MGNTPEQQNVIWRPHPGPQTRFLASGVRDIFYGGAAGGGKSVALIASFLRFFHLPNYRSKIFRRTRTQATEVIIKAKRVIYAAFPGAVWRPSEHAFIHPRGGRFEIGYLRHDDDLENEEGQEYQGVGFDELCQFPEHQANFLHSRLRSPDGIPLQYKGTGNPRGIGLLWVKERYVDPAPPESVIWHKTKLPSGKTVQMSSMFVPALLDDNPSLTGDDSYETSLAALPPKLYDALRWGRWDALMGDAFPEWDTDIHVLTWDQFARMHNLILLPDGSAKLPDHWPIFQGYDWGSASPFSSGWYTSDDNGRLYRIREWYGCLRDRNGKTIPNTGTHMPVREQAHGMLEREERWGIRGRVQMRVADASIFDDRGVDTDGPSYGEMFAEEGVFFTRADKRRLMGKGQLHDRLRPQDFDMPSGEVAETPALMVIKEACPEWLRTVPLLPSCPRNPEDVDTTAEDHAYDETRYVLMSRPWTPKLKPSKPKWLSRTQTGGYRRVGA